jgi:Membrane protease subunits, stomatin/prohibitin homologs
MLASLAGVCTHTCEVRSPLFSKTPKTVIFDFRFSTALYSLLEGNHFVENGLTMDQCNNFITRRRNDRRSSFLREDLLQNDHLVVSSSSYFSPPSTEKNDQGRAGRQHSSSTLVGPAAKLPHHTYDPFDYHYHEDYFLDHPTSNSYTQENDILFLSTPRPMTIGRLLRTQTPARTRTTPSHISMPHNSIAGDDRQQVMMMNSLDKDLSETSFFYSYGCMCCQCVRTAEIGIFDSCGKYRGLADPGCHCLPWPLTDIIGRLSLRINQLEVVCETKTSDSVFCKVSLAVPFRVIGERAYHAYYRLTDPRRQIEAHVFDVVRSAVPRMTLDELFQSKTEIAKEVDLALKDSMNNYGYEVMNTLVIDIRPEEKVIQAMNEVNASKRLKLAMVHLAEAEKVKKIKEAEARAEAMHLNGVGIGGKQRALAKGLKSTINAEEYFSRNQVTSLVLIAQYNDLITSLSRKNSVENSSLVLPVDIAQISKLTEEVGAYHC